MAARERELRKLCDAIGGLREQATQLSEQHAKQLVLAEDRQQHFSDLLSLSQQHRSDCDSAVSRKRQLEKEAERMKSRLDAEANSLGKLKTKETEIARHAGKVVDSRRALARRKTLMHLQVLWSKGLMNREMRALSCWRLSL